MTFAALPRMVSEVLRTCDDLDKPGAIMTVILNDAAAGKYRARGSALYTLSVSFSWRPDLAVVPVVTAGGVPVEWTFTAVAAWAEKTLAGWPVRLAIDFNAGRLGLPFEGVRLARHAAYMAALVPGDMTAAADALRAKWAGAAFDSVARAKAEGRAARIDGLAALLLDMQP